MARPVAAAIAYVAAVVGVMTTYYVDVRTAQADEVVDWNAVLLMFVPLGLFLGLMTRRAWALLVPLAGVFIGFLTAGLAIVDETYARKAAQTGGPEGGEWINIGIVIAMFSLPAVAVTVGLAHYFRARRHHPTEGVEPESD